MRTKAKQLLFDITDSYYFEYFPAISMALGCQPAGIFLCYLSNLHGMGNNREGWIYKTIEEAEAETGLSKNQQKTAIDVLIKKNFLVKERKGARGRRHFKLDLNEIECELPSLLKTSKHARRRLSVSSKQNVYNSANTELSGNEQSLTEHTHKHTHHYQTSPIDYFETLRPLSERRDIIDLTDNTLSN